jgi:hypothetical protein
MKNLKVCNAHSYLYPRSRFKGSQDLLIIVHWIAASQEDEMMCKFTIAIITFSPAKLCEVSFLFLSDYRIKDHQTIDLSA